MQKEKLVFTVSNANLRKHETKWKEDGSFV